MKFKYNLYIFKHNLLHLKGALVSVPRLSKIDKKDKLKSLGVISVSTRCVMESRLDRQFTSKFTCPMFQSPAFSLCVMNSHVVCLPALQSLAKTWVFWCQVVTQSRILTFFVHMSVPDWTCLCTCVCCCHEDRPSAAQDLMGIHGVSKLMTQLTFLLEE